MLFRKLALLLPWNRRNQEQSLEEELRSHLELAAEDASTQGATPEDAKFAARRDLGSLLRAREDVRSVWGFAVWDGLKRDCLYSMRSLAHARSFTVVAILSLGVGIGSATAIFSLLNTVVLRPLSYRQPDRLVNVREIVTPLAGTYPSVPVNYQHFLFWRDHVRSFEELAAVEGFSEIAYLTDDESFPVEAAHTSVSLFPLLGVHPQIGHSFLPEEGKEGHSDVVIITDSLWSRRFGRAPDVVGKIISLNYRRYTVVGVLPPQFRFPKSDDLGPLIQLGKNTELFFPLTGSYSNGWGGDYDYVVFGRLRPRISIAQAAAELDTLEHEIDVEHRLKEGLHVFCKPLQDVIAAPIRTPLYVLMAAVLMLLLIVCANLANLVLARSSVRTREFSIRAALGAGRAKLIQQIVMETLLLGFAGGALGLALAIAGLHFFVANSSVHIPRLDEVQVDARVFAFTLAVSVICGLCSGVLPAVRTVKLDTREALSATSHTVVGGRQSLHLREILIACEVAVSFVLLVGAGLVTSSLVHLLSMDKGFTTEQTVAIDVTVPWVHYKTGQDQLHFWDLAIEQLRSIPGVQSAAFTSKLPLTGESMVNDVVLDGSEQAAVDPVSHVNVEINVRYVSPDYFTTFGIPLVKGRTIEPADRNHLLPAVVSARLATKLWPQQNALGKKFKTRAGVGTVEVIGIVKDVHATTLDKEPTLVAYVPYWHRPLGSGSLVVRTASDPAALIPVIRKRLHELDPTLPVPQTRTISKLVSESLARRYFQVRLASGFALAALALALIGIYGVVGYHVAQRRTEIGVRLALGATRMDVFSLLLRRGLQPVFIGLALGLVLAVVCARLIRSLLFGVKASDPIVLLSITALLGVTALCACLLPARHAAQLHPSNALRYE